MKNPLVSVIVPSYNHRKFVEQALQSIVDQTYKNIELIVIDDGSTDGSAQFLNEFIPRLPLQNKVLILQENQGAHNTLNTGLKMARGEYVTILNSDDFYYPDRFEKMLSHCLANDAKFVFSMVQHIDEDGRPLTTGHYRLMYMAMLELEASFKHNFMLLGYNLAITTGNLFFHRSVAQSQKFASYRNNHDWDFLLQAMINQPVHFLKEFLMSYRIHSTNTISSSYDDSKDCRELLIDFFSKTETTKDSGWIPCAKNYPYFFQWFLSTLFPLTGLYYKESIQSLNMPELNPDDLEKSDMVRALKQFTHLRPEWFNIKY